MNGRNVLYTIALVLLVVGGLNWGLVGAAQFDLVAALFGVGTTLTRVVYVLVGLSALYVAFAAWMQPAGRVDTVAPRTVGDANDTMGRRL